MTRSFFRARSLWATVVFLPALSCDSASSPSAGVQSPPAHPAVSAPVSKVGGGHSSSSSLPAGHPPVAPSRPAPEHSPGVAPATGGNVVERLGALGLVCKLPEGWQEEPPANQMRLGQARLPRVAGDNEDGEVSISPAMGSLDANVKRWSNEQFVEKPQPVLTQRTVGNIQATIVELEGTFTGAGGPMMKTSGAPKPGTKLIGVIASIPGAQQMIFFKAWGPKATMEHWRPSFDALVATFQGQR